VAGGAVAAHAILQGTFPSSGSAMRQSIVHVALLVDDYDRALDFYLNTLRFELIEDTFQPAQNKRWVVIAPPGSSGTTLLLAKASTDEQQKWIGNQAGGRVFLFLNTDDFWRDYHDMVAAGVRFVRPPTEADYGMVAVFEDLYGNRWDLLQLRADHPVVRRIDR
jgi:catechol 2,3-dioxygenase-like lactoylglutathione lyase family enzyme